MKKKKIILSLLVLTLSICSAFAFVACKKSNNDISLSSFQDVTEKVEYGTLYCVDDTIFDNKGMNRLAEGTAFDTEGKIAELSGNKLLISDIGGYTIKQSVAIGEKLYERTKTLEVYSNFAPTVAIGEFSQNLYYGRTYQFPEVQAYDYVDGEITAFTYEVYSRNDGGDIKRTVGAESYTPEVSGKQYLKISATNSQGITGFAIKDFTVREKPQAGEYEAFSDEASVNFLTVHTSVSTGKKYYEEFNGKKGVGAVGLRADTIERTVLRVRPYLTDKSNYVNYEYFAVTMYVEGSIDGISLFSFDKAFKFEGENAVRRNEWHTYLFPAEKVLEKWENIVSEGPLGNSAILRATAGEQGGTIYIDSMYFANVAEPEVKTSTAGKNVTVDITVNGVSGLFDFAVTINGLSVKKEANVFVAEQSGVYTIELISLKGDMIYLGKSVSVGVYYDKSDDNIGYDKPWKI